MALQLVTKLPHMVKKSWQRNGRFKFIITAIGLFVSYSCVGILQEIIMKRYYGSDEVTGEKFKYENTLVEVYLMLGLIFIKIWIYFEPQKKDKTPIGFYAIAALANILAMVTSYTALRWVSYPTQTIFKSCKPVAIMVIGLMFCKWYKLQRYVCVLLMVTGVIFFKIYEPKDDKKTQNIETEAKAFEINSLFDYDYQLLGIGLLTFSLAMDGVLGAFQDKIRTNYKPTSQQMMLSLNTCGSCILLVVIIGTGELVEIYEFTSRHPEALWHIAIYGLAGSIGQMFIYTMVSSFGSLANSVTTTVRKFCSIVFSIIFFGHPSSPVQWAGAALVFIALFADTFLNKKKEKDNSDTKDLSALPNNETNITDKNIFHQVSMDVV